MKRISLLIVAILFLLVSVVSAQMVTLPQEPPIQVSTPQVEDGYIAIAWIANSETDLGGYIVGYSLGGTGYVYGVGQTFDVGDTTEATFVDFPPAVWALMAIAEQEVWIALYAYDQAAGIPDSTYQDGDNISGASDSVSIYFFVDQAPLATQGVYTK